MSTNPPWFTLPKHKHLTADYSDTRTQVVIVGGGLAGCHLAYELAQRDINVVLVDASDTIAGGASSNTAGIVKPFVTRDSGRSDEFYKAAFAFLIDRLDANNTLRVAAQFNQCGVLQLLERGYPRSDAYDNCSATQATMLAGIEINTEALHFERGGWLNPAMLCKAIVRHRNIDVRLQVAIQNIAKTESGWSLKTPNTSIDCATLVLANGKSLHQFTQTQELPITPASGQTSRFKCNNDTPLKKVVTGKRYAIPDGNDIVVGASFKRDNQETRITADEHQENRLGLNALLPSLNVLHTALSGYCGIRATTPDRLPLVGPVPHFSHYRTDYALLKNGLPHHRFPNARYQQGLFVIGGFGSRGIVSAPYCAQLLADHLCGPSLTPEQVSYNSKQDLSSWSALLHPGRFVVRDLKRAHHLVY